MSKTIAAIATGMTGAGIGIVRISGDDAIAVADKIFEAKSGIKLSDAKTHTIHYGHIVSDGQVLDEVLVSVMKGPHSYTGEDTAEINCHGGLFVVKKVLDAVLTHGAQLAEPGEFTKRAFLNGKIDLSKAEAVMDLIASNSDFALKNSLKSLGGNVSNEIKGLREKILYEIAFIESALDDPEHFDLTGYPDDLKVKIQDIVTRIDKLISNAGSGKILKDGVSTVIVGKPNAGKSSFLNLLLGEDKAIVTDTAGTTRDIIEESVRLDDIVLNIIDTAGIRDTDDEIEKIGVDKARKYAADADLVLYMVDSSIPLDENDDDIIEMLHDKKTIVLLNKTDLETVTSKDDLRNILGDVYIINISAKENLGIDEFKDVVKTIFYNDLNYNEDVIITNVRQINELRECLSSLKLVINSIDDGMPEDFYSIDLQNAYVHLGYIIGEEISDDVADEIFSKFCMGK